MVLTGKLAEQDVKNVLDQYSADQIEVKVLNISLAAFLTPEIIINSLKDKDLDLSQYQYVLVPGLMVGDLNKVENKLGVKVFKGPKYACDIPLIINSDIELSKKISADKLLVDYGINEYDDLIETIDKQNKELFKIGNVKIGGGYPPRILAEIVDAPRLSIQKIVRKAEYYIDHGADMLDVGAIVGEDNSKKLGKIIEELKSRFNKISLSIDSLNPAEIEAGVENGAELVLSIDEGNIERLKNLDKKVCYTVIPTNIKEGYFPKKIDKRIEKLENNINLAKNYGFNKILADPLLESPINPGLMNSLVIFHQFSTHFPEIPTLAGIGNVFELIDADSVGINAILASIALELNISVLLTTEFSKKARNAVDELSTGLKMAFLAIHKKQPPNGLPYDLLRAKSKKDLLPAYEIKDEILIKDSNDTYTPDPKGYFKIWVDHLEIRIYINYYKDDILIYTISGIDAESIGKRLIDLKIISKLSHSMYLGRELERAEICLYLGKTYAQDIKFEES